MSEWNFDMNAAPKGVSRTIKSGKGTAEIFDREYVFLACPKGELIIKSFWVMEDQRWNGIAIGKPENLPIAWMRYPDHPNKQKEQG